MTEKKKAPLSAKRKCPCGKRGCRHQIQPWKNKKRFWCCPACYIRFLRNGSLAYRNDALRSQEDLDRASNLRIVEEWTWAAIAAEFKVHQSTVLRRVKRYWAGNAR